MSRSGWLDDTGVLSQTRHGGAHGGEIDKQRNAGKILQQHARHDKRNLFGAFAVWLPVGELAHVVFRDLFAVAVSQHGFKNDAQAVRESGNKTDAVLFELWKR